MTLLLIGSIVLTVFGTLAYLGVIKRWSPVDRGLDEYLGFSALYGGLSLASFAIAAAFDDSLLTDVFFGVGAALILFTILSIFYLPNFLLPAWWKAQHRRPKRK